MDDIERLARTFWIHTGDPHTTQCVDRPDLFCRMSDSSPGDNEVVRFWCEPKAVDALMAEVSALFQGTDCIFCVFPQLHGPAVDDALSRHGFQPTGVFEGRVARIEDIAPRAISGVGVRMVTCIKDLKDLYSIRTESAGRTFRYTDTELSEILQGCTGENPPCRRFLAFDLVTGQPMAQGSMVICRDLGLAMLFGGGTAEEHRTKGAYTALLNARIEYARDAQLDEVGIFAKRDTASPILERRGFRSCGTMVEWTRNDGPK